jgi:hypothetical protein
MNKSLDLPRLSRALDDAIAAVPIDACKAQEASVRRACQEMALYLFHLKEVAARLQSLHDLEQRP